MQLEEPCPLEAIPARVKSVLLNEFQRRWPAVQEIVRISDRQWSATPGVGPTVLQQMRSITHPPQHGDLDLPRLADAELLDRLEFLQEEFRWIQRTLRAKTRGSSRKSFQRRDYVAG
jgi:hypothetical protein